jgi:two-component system OmpR family response regulator
VYFGRDRALARRAREAYAGTLSAPDNASAKGSAERHLPPSACKVRGVRILLVEDSERVVAVVSAMLKQDAHAVCAASTASDALATVTSAHFDLAIVDVGLPDASGFDVCRTLRKDGHALPILLLTARNGVEDRVSGLDAGADDYLGKPFAAAELRARVRALGRRGPQWRESVRIFGELTIDRGRRAISRGTKVLALTPREFDVVAAVAWADGHVVTRDALLESVWGDATEGAAASLDVLLTRIRRKLVAAGVPNAIRTIRNVGYAWALAPSKPV